MVNSYQLAEADMCSHPLHQWLGDIEEWDHICIWDKVERGLSAWTVQ